MFGAREGSCLLRLPSGLHWMWSGLGEEPRRIGVLSVSDGEKPTSRLSHKHIENIKKSKIMQKHINYVADGNPMQSMICAHNGIFPQGLIASFG